MSEPNGMKVKTLDSRIEAINATWGRMAEYCVLTLESEGRLDEFPEDLIKDVLSAFPRAVAIANDLYEAQRKSKP